MSDIQIPVRIKVLRPVQDQELRKSLVELNMIRNVKIDDGGSAPSSY